MIDELRKVIKRLHYPLEVMLVCVRWYAAYPLSLRHIEEMAIGRGVFVDHSTVHRWALKILPALALGVSARKHPVGGSWRMDETYVKVCGQWKYLYRAVDKDGDTVDFLLRAHRDEAAARRFLERPMDLHGVPEKITIDKSGANTAAIVSIQARLGCRRRGRHPRKGARDVEDGQGDRAGCRRVVSVRERPRRFVSGHHRRLKWLAGLQFIAAMVSVVPDAQTFEGRRDGQGTDRTSL